MAAGRGREKKRKFGNEDSGSERDERASPPPALKKSKREKKSSSESKAAPPAPGAASSASASASGISYSPAPGAASSASASGTSYSPAPGAASSSSVSDSEISHSPAPGAASSSSSSDAKSDKEEKTSVHTGLARLKHHMSYTSGDLIDRASKLVIFQSLKDCVDRTDEKEGIKEFQGCVEALEALWTKEVSLRKRLIPYFCTGESPLEYDKKSPGYKGFRPPLYFILQQKKWGFIDYILNKKITRITNKKKTQEKKEITEPLLKSKKDRKEYLIALLKKACDSSLPLDVIRAFIEKYPRGLSTEGHVPALSLIQDYNGEKNYLAQLEFFRAKGNEHFQEMLDNIIAVTLDFSRPQEAAPTFRYLSDIFDFFFRNFKEKIDFTKTLIDGIKKKLERYGDNQEIFVLRNLQWLLLKFLDVIDIHEILAELISANHGPFSPGHDLVNKFVEEFAHERIKSKINIQKLSEMLDQQIKLASERGSRGYYKKYMSVNELRVFATLGIDLKKYRYQGSNLLAWYLLRLSENTVSDLPFQLEMTQFLLEQIQIDPMEPLKINPPYHHATNMFEFFVLLQNQPGSSHCFPLHNRYLLERYHAQMAAAEEVVQHRQRAETREAKAQFAPPPPDAKMMGAGAGAAAPVAMPAPAPARLFLPPPPALPQPAPLPGPFGFPPPPALPQPFVFFPEPPALPRPVAIPGAAAARAPEVKRNPPPAAPAPVLLYRADDKQSTHTTSIHRSANESAIKLRDRYLAGLTEEKRIKVAVESLTSLRRSLCSWALQESLNHYDKNPSETDKRAAFAETMELMLSCQFERNQRYQVHQSFFTQPHISAYYWFHNTFLSIYDLDRNPSQFKKSGRAITIDTTLYLIWKAMHDDNIFTKEQQADLEKELFITTSKLQREYNKKEDLEDQPSCPAGAFHALLDILHNRHPDVFLQRICSKTISMYIKDFYLEKLKKLPAEEKNSLLEEIKQTNALTKEFFFQGIEDGDNATRKKVKSELRKLSPDNRQKILDHANKEKTLSIEFLSQFKLSIEARAFLIKGMASSGMLPKRFIDQHKTEFCELPDIKKAIPEYLSQTTVDGYFNEEDGFPMMWFEEIYNDSLELNELKQTITQDQLFQKISSKIQAWEKYSFPPSYAGARNLQAEAANYGYECADIFKEGNSFFHAVADQLNRLQEEGVSILDDEKRSSWDQHVLYSRATEEIMSHLPMYKGFMEGAPNVFINNNPREGALADHLMIEALCRSLHINIAILKNDRSGVHRFDHAPDRPYIYLGYEAGLRYHSLRTLYGVVLLRLENAPANLHTVLYSSYSASSSSGSAPSLGAGLGLFQPAPPPAVAPQPAAAPQPK